MLTLKSQMEIQKNVDVTDLSTLRIKAVADHFAQPKNIEELIELLKFAKDNGIKVMFLGGGSNALLSSKKIDSLLISTLKIDFIKEDINNVFDLGVGLKMPRFCGKMIHKSLTGAEFMVGIPGSIGGGLVMNAGAHGREFADIFVSAKVLDLETLEIHEFNHNDMNFSYRSSVIDPERYCVLSVKVKLEFAEKEEIRSRVASYNKSRTTSQPLKAWTCGCTFKNPQSDYPAGKLIQDIGGKELSIGEMQVSDVHANFFENTGSASSSDFIELVSLVQGLAIEKKNIQLLPEVQPIGFFTEDERKIWLN